MMTDEQAKRIGALYGEALSNYDDLGTFQLALSNAMTYRSYNWDIDKLENVLTVMVEMECSTNPARNEDYEQWDWMMEKLRNG